MFKNRTFWIILVVLAVAAAIYYFTVGRSTAADGTTYQTETAARGNQAEHGGDAALREYVDDQGPERHLPGQVSEGCQRRNRHPSRAKNCQCDGAASWQQYPGLVERPLQQRHLPGADEILRGGAGAHPRRQLE